MKPMIYVSNSPDGWHNLALDEYFLDTVQPDEILLYFYINASAVIIGRGQNPWLECRLNDMEKDSVQLVRRITGGGAVFHDSGNLNFSFIAGKDIYDVQRQLSVILSAVRALGIPCDFTGRNDLVANGLKFSGNAFCARGDISQHHGTLLISSDLSRLQNYLNVDPRKLKAKGAKSVRSRVCNLSDFNADLTVDRMLGSLIAAFEAEYGAARHYEASDIDEAALMPYLRKQASAEWRLGKTPRFDTEIENRFEWGNAQLLLTLREGRVAEIEVYSDALDPKLPELIADRLRGVPFGSGPMCAALLQCDRTEFRDLAAYIYELAL